MKLYAIDQVSISSVSPDTIKPGTEFAVSDSLGNDLLKKVPHLVSKDPPKPKADPVPPNKAAPPPPNKSQAEAEAKAKADAEAKAKDAK